MQRRVPYLLWMTPHIDQSTFGNLLVLLSIQILVCLPRPVPYHLLLLTYYFFHRTLALLLSPILNLLKAHLFPVEERSRNIEDLYPIQYSILRTSGARKDSAIMRDNVLKWTRTKNINTARIKIFRWMPNLMMSTPQRYRGKNLPLASTNSARSYTGSPGGDTARPFWLLVEGKRDPAAFDVMHSSPSMHWEGYIFHSALLFFHPNKHDKQILGQLA